MSTDESSVKPDETQTPEAALTDASASAQQPAADASDDAENSEQSLSATKAGELATTNDDSTLAEHPTGTEPPTKENANLTEASQTETIADNDGDSQMNDATENKEFSLSTQPVAEDEVPKSVIRAEDVRSDIEERARQYLAKQIYRIIIPSFAAWFERSKCHEIEKKSLPEFFNGKHRTKTPEIYIEYRNFMIDTYRLNPSEYLTFTACRRNLAGDVAAIMRVFQFLETWGLINYQIDPETRPSTIGPQFTGHFQVLLDTPQGIVPFIPAKNSKYTEGKPHETEDVIFEDSDEKDLSLITANGSVKNDTSVDESSVKIKSEPEEENKSSVVTQLNLRRNIYDSTADAIALQDESQRQLNAVNTRTYNCYTCGDDTTKVRYHNLRSKQSLSPLCFQNGFFPSNFSSADFVKIVKAQSSSTEWTDQEILLLIEGVEMFEDDWNAIAYHVGTRTREACIVKFVQLPIEDPYLVQSHSGSKGENGTSRTSFTSSKESGTDLYKALKEHLKQEKNPETAAEAKEINNLIAKRAAKAVEGETEHLESNLGLLVTAELEKIKAKLSEFERVERVLAQEKQEVELAQQQLLYDRMALKYQSELVLGKLQQAASVAIGAVQNAANAATIEAQVAVGKEIQNAAELAKAAQNIASQPLKRLSPTTASELGGSAPPTGSEPSNKDILPGLNPVSLDAPQTFTLWSA